MTKLDPLDGPTAAGEALGIMVNAGVPIPTQLFFRVFKIASSTVELPKLQTDTVRIAERVLPRMGEDQFDGDLAAVEAAIQAPRRGSPRGNAIIITEVLRHWHGDRGAANARHQKRSKRHWEKHVRMLDAGDELLAALNEVLVGRTGSSDEQQLREVLSRCMRIWKHYARAWANDWDLGEKELGRPRLRTLTYKSARLFLMRAGLSGKVAERLLAGRHR